MRFFSFFFASFSFTLNTRQKQKMAGVSYLRQSGASQYGVAVPATAQVTNGIAHSPGTLATVGAGAGGGYNPWTGGIQAPIAGPPGSGLSAQPAGAPLIVIPAGAGSLVTFNSQSAAVVCSTYMPIYLVPPTGGAPTKYWIPLIPAGAGMPADTGPAAAGAAALAGSGSGSGSSGALPGGVTARAVRF